MKDKLVWVRAMAMFSFVVTDLVGGVGLGLLVGWLLVSQAGVNSIIYLPTTIVGFGLGMYRVVIRSKQASKEEENS